MLIVFVILLVFSITTSAFPAGRYCPNGCAPPPRCNNSDLIPEITYVTSYLSTNWTAEQYGVIETNLKELNRSDIQQYVGHIVSCTAFVGGFIIPKWEGVSAALVYAWDADVLSIIVAKKPAVAVHYIKL